MPQVCNISPVKLVQVNPNNVCDRHIRGSQCLRYANISQVKLVQVNPIHVCDRHVRGSQGLRYVQVKLSQYRLTLTISVTDTFSTQVKLTQTISVIDTSEGLNASGIQTFLKLSQYKLTLTMSVMDTSVGLKCPRHSNMSPTKSNMSPTKLPPPPPPTKKCPKVSALVFFLFFYTKPMRVLTFCFLKIASGVTVPTPYTVCLQPTNSSRQCFFSRRKKSLRASGFVQLHILGR